MTLSPYVHEFVSGRAKQGSYNRKSVSAVLPRLRLLSDHFGNRPLNQFTTRAILSWLETISHLSPNSRAAYMGSVRQFTAWMVSEGIITTDPSVGVPKIRRERRVPRAQSQDAIARLLAACEDDRDRAIVWLEVGLGLRRAEVASIRWEHYDARNRMLLVKGKGGHERELPVIDEVAWALERIRMRGDHGPIIRSKVDPNVGVDPSTVGKRVSDLMREAGIKHAPYDGVSSHALRHTAASDVLDNCGDIRVVQQMLGHENLATTAIYLRRASIGAMREAMAGRSYGHLDASAGASYAPLGASADAPGSTASAGRV